MQARDPAIIVRTTAGAIIGWNEAAEHVLGYSAREVLGSSIRNIIPDDPEPDQPVVERTCITRNGRPLRVMCRRSSVTDGADGLLAVCEVIVPLGGEQREATVATRAHSRPLQGHEAALLAERQRLLAVLESSPGVVLSYRLSRDGQESFSFVSPAAYELYGFTPAQIEANAALISSRIDPEDARRGAVSHEESARTLALWTSEFRYRHPSGQLKWLEARFRPTREPEGTLLWNGVVLDVTSRKQTEERLMQLQTQLDEALAATGLGAWMLDLDSGKAWGNDIIRSAWEVPEHAPEWYDAQEARAATHPEDHAWLARERQRALETGGLMDANFRMVRTDGSVRWVSTRARAARDDAGRTRRLVGVQLDITEQKAASEAALRSSKLEALGTLSRGIAHDFNNVLFAITGNAGLTLAALPVDSPARAFVKEIASAAARATELVRQIVVFSRPDEQERSVLAPATVVQEALAFLRATTSASVEIASHVHPLTPAIEANASRLEQIIVNLCTNAASSIGKGRAGRIEVRAEPCDVGESDGGATPVPPGRYALITVRDNGCGMDAYTKSRIFDPFFTTKPTGEGTGLGLSVVHGVVNALGGHITVASEPGVGSTFRIYLPAAIVAAAADAHELAMRTESGSQRILFVDDEAMLVQLAENVLAVLGYEAVAFQDAARALEAFRAAPESFSAAITDLSMPSMSGFDLARALLDIRKDLPILVLSGYVGLEERKVAEELGVRELVLKPVTMARMRELLARLCGAASARQADG